MAPGSTPTSPSSGWASRRTPQSRGPQGARGRQRRGSTSTCEAPTRDILAFQCLWSLGFQTYGTRVLLHSLAGCAFYGVLVTKLLALRTRRLPTWAIPVLGGARFTVLVALWLTSSLWYFTHGSPGRLVVHRSDSYRAQQPSWVGPGSCQLRTRCGGQQLTASR
ncbi:MAG TPA: DUF6529 family protein [Candidatus Nanopelagicales bacterium]